MAITESSFFKFSFLFAVVELKTRVNVLPLFGMLFTFMSALFLVASSLHRNKPNPVPGSFKVPGVEINWSLLKSLAICSGFIPTPSSLIESSWA